MEDWQAIAAEVAAALRDVGFSVTLHRSGGRDPASPEYDPTFLPDTDHPLTVMQDALGLSQIDGTLIKAGDIRLICAAEGIRPTQADRVTVQGVNYAVVMCEPFSPAGVDLYYDLVLRA